MQVRRHLESEDCLVTGRVRALRLNLRADLNRPSATLSNSALLRPRRSRTTCKNAGLHSGEPSIADKDEAAGSSPARPTKLFLTSGNAHLLSAFEATAPVSRLRAAVSERIPPTSQEMEDLVRG